MEVDNLIWENVRTQFEKDFRGTTTVSSVKHKLPEIRQKDNETVIQYVSRCEEILFELKTKTDVLDVNVQLQLNDAKTATYNGIKEV